MKISFLPRSSMPAGFWPNILPFIACASLSLQAQGTNSPALVSAIHGSGQTAAADSFAPIISRNGQALVFTSLAGDLVPLPTNPSMLNVYWKEWPDGPVQLISVNADATGGGNGSSSHPSISSNGQWVCFASRASDLAGNDSNDTTDIFLRDVAAGTTTLLSVNSTGTAAGQGQSSRPHITPDGRWVVFVSDAPDLVADDTNGITDVFVRDLTIHQTRLASVGGDFVPAFRNAGLNGVSLSADGTRVSFASRAADYHPLMLQTNAGEIYVRDMALNQTWWASSNAASFLPHIPPQDVRSFDSILSPDGRSVVFKVQTNEFTSRNLQFTSLLLHHDLESGDTSLLATNAGTETTLSWSDDSRWMTFATDTDVYRWDRENGESQLVSVNSTGEQPGNGPSHTPILSADGNAIAFLSSAADLTTNDVPGTSQVYLRDLTGQTTTQLSANDAGEPGNRHHTGTVPSLDGAGRLVAFDSESGNLVPGDWNRAGDVFVWSSEATGPALISRALSGVEPPATGVSQKVLSLREFSSRDGRYVAFISDDDVFDVGDTNGYHDVYVRDTWEQATLVVARGAGGAMSPGLLSGDPIITSDGSQVFFTRREFSFTTATPPGEMEIWRFDLRNGMSELVRAVTLDHWGSVHTGTGQFHNLVSASDDGLKLTYVDDSLIWVEDLISGERTIVSSFPNGQGEQGNYSAPQFVPQR